MMTSNLRRRAIALVLGSTASLGLAACGPEALPDPDDTIEVEEAAVERPSGNEFSVMTYNVRHVTSEDTGKYEWKQRKGPLVELIVAESPDILGVQEASAPELSDPITAGLEATHDRFQPSNRSPKTVYFRRDRFRLSNVAKPTGYIRISNPYSSSETCYKNAGGRSATWVKLDDLKTGEGLFVVNSHPAHNYRCHLAREVNARALRKEISANAEGRTVIVLGDLNSDPTHPDFANDASLDIISNGGTPALVNTLASTARTSPKTMSLNTSWKKPSNGKRRYDHVYISSGTKTRSPRFIRTTFNGITPSDHFPYVVTVQPE